MPTSTPAFESSEQEPAGPEPRPGLRDEPPYRSPQLDVPVRLATNESPRPLPEAVADELAAAARTLALNRYPDREARELRAALAGRHGHPVEGVWVANGSNEILAQLLSAHGGPGRVALTFEPTYAMHGRIASLSHTEVRALALDPPWALGEAQAEAAGGVAAGVVFVCSPNNPTGNAQPLAAIARIAEAAPRALVVVDQAYLEFGGESALPLAVRRRNVVVVRTFSKAFAMAGARVGYCLADPAVVEDLRRVALPYHLSALSQAAALAALRAEAAVTAAVEDVRRQRDRLRAALAAVPGVEAFPSDANFVLFRPPRPAGEVWRGLLDRGVLVRDLSGQVPNCLRVTAATAEEVDAFLAALTEVLA